ncbi:ATPase family associated with various cellular activities (AAA) [Kibdelosporangium aridum]|uniref:ATPase family associated with various cellular activities (AAA) n=2 Tax=Kibdelosporangium aridum TaxID=2030 RepID=A0A1W2FL83_KIBAR|nr:ATPase family associated with various cellular activities (AAA) [Kibdelosporangium aridum]
MNLPHGVSGIHVLPADHHDGPWESIIVPPGTKERLLGTAVLVLRHGRALQSLSGPPHGLVVLAGPPGTGKTTLCQGLAQAAAMAVANRGATTFVEVDPHAFPSEMLGESQRAVRRLFAETLPELAARRPHTVVLVDEVEALAVRRSAASFETNPVDVHRATDAVLSGLDALRAACPHLLLLATTNFTEGVDEAFLSRADLVLRLDLPDVDVLARIIRSSLAELATLWPTLRGLAQDEALHAKLAGLCEGFDGRRTRKAVLAAVAGCPELAENPERLTADDLSAAVEAAQALSSVTTPL